MSWEKQETFRLLKGAPGTAYQESDETNRAVFRDWIKSLLQKQSVTVEFTKSDGSNRTMLCTLNWETIPESHWPNGTMDIVSAKKPLRETKEPEALRVFDLDKQEWRSFRYDRLKKIVAEISFQ